MVILYKFRTIAQDSKLYTDLSIVNRMGEPVAFECAENLNLFNTFTHVGLFFCFFVCLVHSELGSGGFIVVKGNLLVVWSVPSAFCATQ